MFRRSSAFVIGGHTDRNLAVAAVAYAPIPALLLPYPGNSVRIASDFHPVGFVPGIRLRQPADNGNAFMNSRIVNWILYLNSLYRSAASDTAPQSATALTVCPQWARRCPKFSMDIQGPPSIR